MPFKGTIWEEGIFVNPDAMDLRTKKSFAKLLKNVLKIASDEINSTDLFIENRLTPEMGTEGKFYNWGQLSAQYKPDGVPTDIQKVQVGDETYTLKEWEIKVGITDRAKINSQMTAQDILTAGSAGRGFARRIDTEGFSEIYTTNTGTACVAAWGGATDAQVQNDIILAQGRLRAAGWTSTVALLTFTQMSRLATSAQNIGAGITFKRYMNEHLFVNNYIVVDTIAELNPDGSANTLFNPTGSFILLDEDAYGVFTQRPTTMEYYRDVPAGLDLAIMRKYFGFKGVQATAAQAITGIGI